MSIKNLKTRLNYRGGANQIDRMNKDKLRSLKSAINYSYQSATVELNDGRLFKCLINPNKLSLDVDNKIISIPFYGIRVNDITDPDSPVTPLPPNEGNEGVWEDMEDMDIVALAFSTEGSWEDMKDDPTEPDPIVPDPVEPIPKQEEEIGLKEGDVICWKDNDTHWLVYLRYLEETAYFRANLRRCRHEVLLRNGSKYWAYIRGPVEQSILWGQASNNYFNKLNYSLVMYITNNTETQEIFKRFAKIKIDNKPWEIQTVDSISTPGILEVSLKETYTNTIEDNVEKIIEEIEKPKEEEPEEMDVIYISGDALVYPYDSKTYEIQNYFEKGAWQITNASRKNMLKTTVKDNQIQIDILTGKSGSFTLEYLDSNNFLIAALDITIGSL